MQKFIIRFAEYKDISAIMKFIDEYWRKGHILANDRDLFIWQYFQYNRVNFVLGIDSYSKIQGILGFIFYDEGAEKDIALALWQANQCEEKMFLGIELLMFLMKNEEYRSIVCTGINMKTTSKIYQHLGMEVGSMKQWYRIRNKEKYSIAIIEDHRIPIFVETDKYSFVLCTKFDEIERTFDFEEYKKKTNGPYKSKSYLKQRYFNHPIYKYKVFRVVYNNIGTTAIVVFRIQECNQSRVVRFVDFIGDIFCLKFITQYIDELLCEWDAEYVDMYEVGVTENILLDGGWLPVKNSRNIIPNYFAPYEQSNVEINYSSSNVHAILFRGDGDQDRPN